ncbi:uncharacterized protein LOC143216874 [Lasioglossum baleicum]|uniref:uncharacterized protein LOC143216874 n=1 Tax=Lasioglossum baleicum TaxID=434251 RepID=UPI003FCC8F2A
MVQTCCIKNCKERQNRDKNISFHKFPKNPELREKWIKAINRKDFEPSVHSRICSKHFEKDCFVGNAWSTKRNLKYDALPCVLKAPPETPRTQPIEIVSIPCIKTEIESASSNNEFADDDGSFESVTDEDDVPIREIPMRKKRTAYVGDILKSNMITDRDKHAHIIGRTLTKKNRQIKTLQQTNRRLLRKVKELEGLVDELRKRSMDV